MEVLLRQDVAKLGGVGDIVRVKAGYARNFLLPMGMAVELTKGNLKQLQHEKKKLLALESRRKDRFRGLADRLQGASISIPVEANEAGALYGSVTAKMIAEHLNSQGYEVDARAILLDAPIREIGMHSVRVRLHAEVETETKVWVVENNPNKDKAEDA